MLEGLCSAGPFVLVLGKQLADKVFCVLGDVCPYTILERELAQLHFFHNLLVSGTIKWWDARKYNVGNHSYGPNVALGTVVLSKNFRRDIVRCTELFVEFLAFVINE